MSDSSGKRARGGAGNRFVEALAMFKCASPVFPNDFGALARVNDRATVADAFRVLIERRVMCVPVVSAQTGEVLALFTLADVVAHVLALFTDEELRKLDHAQLFAHNALTRTPVLGVPLTTQEAVQVLPPDATALDAARVLVANAAHRVVVLDAENQPANLISQSRLIALAAGCLHGVPGAARTLHELGLGRNGCIQVREEQAARDAFQLMVTNRVSAVAVVNAAGAITGVLSLSDIRKLGYDLRYFYHLSGSCAQLLGHIRVFDATRTIADAEDPLRCTGDMTLAAVIRAFVFYRVHRIFVVDDYYTTRRPVGVVSMLDVLRACISDE